MPDPLKDSDSIDVLGNRCSIRTLNVIANMQCQTIGQLRDYTPEELLRFPNCGKKTLKEIGELIDAPWAEKLRTPAPLDLREVPIEDLLAELARRRDELLALRRLSAAVRREEMKADHVRRITKIIERENDG